MRSKDDLALWRCDRCGEFVKPYTLYVLRSEWPTPLADAGDFCEPCCALPYGDWVTWFREHRPDAFETDAALQPPSET